MNHCRLAIALALLVTGHSAAQEAAAKPGSVQGAVIDAATQMPIAGVEVFLQGGGRLPRSMRMSGRQQGWPVGPAEIQAVSDASGAFTFSSLAPGTYGLTARKRGFVTRGRFTRIVVDAESTLTGVVVGMDRTAVVTGRVTGNEGEPMEGVRITAFQTSIYDGPNEMGAARTETTNELGEYRLFDLPPGRYYLFAHYSNRYGSTHTAAFYPNARTPDAAILVGLNPGQERAGADFVLTPEPTYSLAGRFLNAATGAGVAGTQLGLFPTSIPMYALPSPGNLSGSRDGSVRIDRLPAGDYILEATAPGPGDQFLYSSIEVHVRDRDLTGVEVPMYLGSTIAGVVQSDSGPGPANTLVELRPANELYRFTTVGRGRSDGDGAFSMRDVAPASYILDVPNLSESFYVKAVRFGAQDALASPVRVTPGSQDALELTLEASPASVSGVVTDRDDRTLAGVQVLLVPRDEQPHRTIICKRAGTNLQGRYRFAGLAPGDYRLIAIRDAPTGAEHNAQFLNLYRDDFTSLDLDEGESASVGLKLVEVAEQ